MANATFGVNILPKNDTVTIGNSDSPWNIVSPNMTGTPIAPTAEAGTNTTQVATTAFVNTATSSKVAGPSSSVDSSVAIFDGTNGKIIKDSGYTIGTSVPSNAVFTDTTYESKTASSGGSDVSLVTTGEKYTWNNKINISDKGVNNGVASLDSSGKLISTQVPDSVHDVLEYTDYSDFPLTGETGKIYLDKTTNIIYRWSGIAYVQVTQNISPITNTQIDALFE